MSRQVTLATAAQNGIQFIRSQEGSFFSKERLCFHFNVFMPSGQEGEFMKMRIIQLIRSFFLQEEGRYLAPSADGEMTLLSQEGSVRYIQEKAFKSAKKKLNKGRRQIEDIIATLEPGPLKTEAQENEYRLYMANRLVNRAQKDSLVTLRERLELKLKVQMMDRMELR